MTNPDGCTSVEEWLARGGEITRERDDDEPIIETYDGTRYEWVLQGQATVPCTYRCQRTGVLAHRRTARSKITPYVCRHPDCKAHGRHQGYGSATYCDEHVPEAM